MGNINDLGFPFSSIGGDRQYSALEWREYFAKLIKNGVIQNAGNGAQVKPQAVPNKTVYVDTGVIFIEGAMRIVESVTNLTVADNASGNPRIDRIVARLNYTDRKIEFAVKQGTPGAVPVAPALTRNATVYELALADITLANGYTSITTGVITDQRSDVSLCGAASMTIGVIPPSGLDAVTVQLAAATQALYGGSLNADAALAKAVPLGSYMAFCGNVNATMLDAAFGKSNEDIVSGIGLQMAMYAWFKGNLKATYPLASLKYCNTLAAVLSSQAAKIEISALSDLWLLLYASAYAKGVMLNEINTSATASVNTYSTTQNIDISAADIAIDKIFYSGTISRSQGSVGGSVKLNNVDLGLSWASIGENKIKIINLAACNITVAGTYVLTTAITYGATYPCTISSYIAKLK